MAKWLTTLVAILVLAGTPVAARPASADEARHSGTVAEVARDRVVIEEMGPWSGPGSGLKRRTITLAPDTNVVLFKRTDRWDNTALPGWDSQPLKLSDLKPGDFVTVTERANVATSLHVVRPESDGR